MSNIDTKLKELITDITTDHDTEELGIDKMIQDMVNLKANMQQDMLRLGLTSRDPKLLTGAEWYERFKKELMDIPVLWTDEIPKQLNPYALKVLEAAKKAAGIE